METQLKKPEIDYEFLAKHLAEIWKARGNLDGVALPQRTSPVLIASQIPERKDGRMRAFLLAISQLPCEPTSAPQEPHASDAESG